MFALLKNKKGVTLVELLAVIVIMGIIAAIAIPTIGNLIENQRQNAAQAEWTSIVEAARMYATANPTDADITFQDLVDDAFISGVELEKPLNTAYTGSLFDNADGVISLDAAATGLFINDLAINAVLE